ncbi:MAG: low molecular weight phosphotyrosine protein phosphatase [Clostridiales bacterium]|nr:low molecular weight phosphotyrosine protein phosphatase [Clostridiales bacterium]
MKKILFICHGNICRSPMAELIFKQLVRERGMGNRFSIASAATSTEEIGNPVYPPARAELARHGVPVEKRGACQLTRGDYEAYDLLIGMDNANIRNMHRMLGGDPEGKIHRLMDFTTRPGEVSDPWYSDRFDIAYRDIREGCEALLAYMEKEG